MTERIVQLPSGLTVAVEPMDSTRAVSIGVWVGVGARDEPNELAGVSHFLEHLLFKGTATQSAIELSQTIDRLGGDINAYTSKEYTSFYCRLPARHVATGIGVLSDVLTRPALRDDDIESERQVILEELAMDDDSPEDVVHREFAAAVFAGHPLGRETAGERNTVLSMPAASIRDFFRSHYRTANTVVAVAGAIDPDDTVAQIADAFAAMPEGDGRVPRTPPSPMTSAPAATDIDDDTEQVHLVLGGRSLARDDHDREALDVANHVLGGGLSSRLFDEIRERRGLAYTVFSSSAAFADTGSWNVYAGTLPEHAAEVERLVRLELDRLAADGITDDELAIAQGYLAGAYELGLEDSGARMSRLGGQLTVLGRVRPVEEQLERWSSVGHSDVQRVIERVYAAGDPLRVALGPI
jgi:predicted Zn-dependent peptidase